MFRNPWYLAWLLPALAAAAAAHFRAAARRKALTARLGNPATLSRLIPAESASRRSWKFALELAGLGLLFLALAGPQWGVELVTTSSATHQVMIAVDTSLSMMSEDVKPTRLERAKEELSALLDQLKGNRVGIVAFAGEPAVVCPITTDLDAAKTILRGLEPGAVPVPGTAIGKAIKLASASLQRYPGQKSLVLLTDGEDHKSDPLGAAEEAAGLGIRIFSIGIGTPEGEPIPIKDAGGNLTGYKKDRRGNTVVSHLGEKELTELAARAGGAYYRASPGGSEASEIADRILKTQRSESVMASAHQYRNRFMFPLALAFLVLLIEFLVPERGSVLALTRRRKEAAPTASGAGRDMGTVALILLFLAPGKLSAATAESSLREGNALYKKEQYVPALQAYADSGRRSPKDPRPVFNAGDALYKVQQYDQAAQAFKAVAESKSPPAVRSAAYYNLGNIDYQAGQYGKAVDDFRKSVALNPKDSQAVNNLAVALRRLKNPPPPQKQNQKDQKNKPQDQKDKNNPDRPKGGPQNPPQPKTRPQDQLSKEDAERITRAVSDREKSLRRELQKKAPAKRPDVEEDW